MKRQGRHRRWPAAGGTSLTFGLLVGAWALLGGTLAGGQAVGPSTRTAEQGGSGRAPASVAAPRVMPLGDSITDGYNIPGGYRTELSRRLAAELPGLNFVGSLNNGPAALTDRDHEGHSGWRIDELSAHIDGWLDRSRPDIVLLMIGTNDMIQNRDPANAPARLGALLDRMFARRPDLRVLVSTLPPLADTEQNRRARQYNAALPAVVRSRAAQGRQVRLVDAGAALTLADLADGVHPNARGYVKLAAAWDGALRRTLRPLRS